MFDGAFYVGNQVVVRYAQPTPKYVKIGEDAFVFSCEHGVSLALIDEDKVQSLLDFLGGCCGKRQKIFSLANEATYQHWLTGNGR